MSESECKQCGMTGQCKMDCTEEFDRGVRAERERILGLARVRAERLEKLTHNSAFTNRAKALRWLIRAAEEQQLPIRERLRKAIATAKPDPRAETILAEVRAPRGVSQEKMNLRVELPPRARSESGQSGGELNQLRAAYREQVIALADANRELAAYKKGWIEPKESGGELCTNDDCCDYVRHPPEQPAISPVDSLLEDFEFQWRHLVNVPLESLTPGGQRRRAAIKKLVQGLESSDGDTETLKLVREALAEYRKKSTMREITGYPAHPFADVELIKALETILNPRPKPEPEPPQVTSAGTIIDDRVHGPKLTAEDIKMIHEYCAKRYGI